MLWQRIGLFISLLYSPVASRDVVSLIRPVSTKSSTLLHSQAAAPPLSSAAVLEVLLERPVSFLVLVISQPLVFRSAVVMTKSTQTHAACLFLIA